MLTRGGLIFEGELLHKGGKGMAFAGVFQRPPRNSHEVLHPEAYLEGEKLPTVRVPDMQDVLRDQYEAYDSGGIGELDVRALIKQYGERKIADDFSSAWRGGEYVTYRRKATVPASTADLALLYVSKWKTPEAAERFARFYVGAVSRRYPSATAQAVPTCSDKRCPVGIAQYATDEGPVIVELWQDNTVTVSESFDIETAAKLHGVLRDGIGAAHAGNLFQEEIVGRLFQVPGFEMFAQRIGMQLTSAMSREACRHPLVHSLE